MSFHIIVNYELPIIAVAVKKLSKGLNKFCKKKVKAQNSLSAKFKPCDQEDMVLVNGVVN
jgi:hypothetical protein